MKSFIVLLLVTVVVAEPPRFRDFRYRLPRAEAEEVGGEKESTNSDKDAPYPSAGYRPSKEFKLPSERQEFAPPATSYGIPDNSYRAPLNVYLAPQAEYGVPRRSFEENKEEGKKSEGDPESQEISSEENSEERQEKPVHEEQGERSERKQNEDRKEERKEEKKEKENLEDGSDYSQRSEGAYYVLLPGPQLQRVQYQTLNDPYNMAYTAKLQYRNEDRAPIYVYTAVPAYQAYQAPPTYQAAEYRAPVYQAPLRVPSAAYSAYNVVQWSS